MLDTVDVKISIHALVKRATHKIMNMKNALFISIHALVKRATPLSVTGKHR